jgi:hypothetical protein
VGAAGEQKEEEKKKKPLKTSHFFSPKTILS